MRPLCTFLLLLGVVFLSSGEGLAQGGSPRRSLSQSELRRLQHGRLVVRPTTERRGDMRLIGGTSYQVIDMEPEKIWRALEDRPTYIRRMLPQTQRARELRRSGSSRTLRLTHEYGLVSASYAVTFTYDDRARTVVFRLADDQPSDLRAGWGFIKVRPWGDDGDKSLVSFGMMADVGSGLISGALRPTLHEWMLKVPYTMKKYLEGSGRARYDR